MARVELGELRLARGALALGGARRGALAAQRPLAQRLGLDRLGLEDVDAAQQAGEQPGRVAADLVAAQRQIVDAVEQDREPVAEADRGEERVEPRLDRVLAQQSLGGLLVGVNPELLVRAIQRELGPLAQLRARRARPREHQHALRAGPAGGEGLEPAARAPPSAPSRPRRGRAGARRHARRRAAAPLSPCGRRGAPAYLLAWPHGAIRSRGPARRRVARGLPEDGRRSAGALRSAPRGIAARTEYAGVGEGGDRSLVIDRQAEDIVFGELEALHRDGAEFTAISEERGEVAFGKRRRTGW